MRVPVDVVHALRVEGRGAALDAMDDTGLRAQEFGQVGAILAGHAGDKRKHGLITSMILILQSGLSRSEWSQRQYVSSDQS
jgi:hypothetical protein